MIQIDWQLGVVEKVGSAINVDDLQVVRTLSGSRSSSSPRVRRPAPGAATSRLGDDDMSAEEVRHVAELVDRARIGMLTTMAESGKHVSRPMALQDVEFDGDLWFFSRRFRGPAGPIAAGGECRSTTSRASGLPCPGRRRSLLTGSRPNGCGCPAEDLVPRRARHKGLSLIKVHVDSAEYWESPSSKVRQLIGAALAAATGDPDKFPGTNRSVDLWGRHIHEL